MNGYNIKSIKKNKNIWYTGMVILLSVITVFLISSVRLDPAVETLVLKQGSSGAEVKEVQQRLKNWGYYQGSVDGVFGSQTKEAVLYFQRKNGLTVDGIVGNQTFNALGLTKYATTSTSSAASSDITLLARAIHAEAEGEPYIGKIAVGAVLLNRIDSKDFPNTLSGVVYQSLALESVDNGRFNNSAGEESLRAAKEAYNGYDPTWGCLYFWNPATAVSPWIWTRKIVVRYGKHVFGI